MSVIIPAYNAAASIEETLLSVRHQTHRALEIIVVDDGSGDGTADIVRRHATQDPRIRLIVQPNGGVASARNRGLESARGELIAPIDADDLWAPTKIEKQLAALEKAGPQTALVYTWYAAINGESRITDRKHTPSFEGEVLRRICIGNFVGNGSSPLMRKSAVLACGGYDPGLRGQKAQGCEDLLLYFRIAEHHHFALVREHLTGYRETPDAMSGDVFQMLRSYRLVAREIRAKYPHYAAETRHGEAWLANWLFWRAMRVKKYSSAFRLLLLIMRLDPAYAMPSMTLGLIKAGLRRLWRGGARPASPARFPIGAPEVELAT